MGATYTILRLGEAGVAPPSALVAFLQHDVRGLLLTLDGPTALQGQALASGACPPGQVLALCRQRGVGSVDVLALHAPLPVALAQEWCVALRPGLVHAPLLPELADWLEGRLYRISRAGPAWLAEAGDHIERARYTALVEAGDLAAAEPIIAALAETFPDEAALQKAALGCNLALRQPARASRFAHAVLRHAPSDPVAHLALLDSGEAGDEAAQESSRLAVAMAPAGVLHPLRQLVEAHRLLSLRLSRPVAFDAAALVEQARSLPAEGHWGQHYRSLIEAADPALLLPTPPLSAGRRRGRAQAVLLVAADAHYVRLYGEAYLRSVLAQLDVPARVVLHVIGGGAQAPVQDPRIVTTEDDLDPSAITTRCHDSDGPRAVPVAHFQSIRFAQAERWLARTGLPVIVSDIDVILQRGIADLLERHAADDVVLNRNAASQAFGSHLTANLAMFMPTPQGRAFAASLRGYLDRALARPDVSRWIDQCGLQMTWHAHACGGRTRFGWFDTGSDINNVIYPSWAPNPFRFLSLFHGFDMASLPDQAAGCSRKKRTISRDASGPAGSV